jgi:hypothetical protein
VCGGCGERGKRVNMVQILCTHVCKCKNDTVETTPGIGELEIKENVGGGEIKYNKFDIL